uniref:Activin_recp domain-containing protein n=1 Tax=Syphacia muris TaxID=451379 RepID=A0A0N5ACN2_9BILA
MHEVFPWLTSATQTSFASGSFEQGIVCFSSKKNAFVRCGVHDYCGNFTDGYEKKYECVERESCFEMGISPNSCKKTVNVTECCCNTNMCNMPLKVNGTKVTVTVTTTALTTSAFARGFSTRKVSTTAPIPITTRLRTSSTDDEVFRAKSSLSADIHYTNYDIGNNLKNMNLTSLAPLAAAETMMRITTTASKELFTTSTIEHTTTTVAETSTTTIKKQSTTRTTIKITRTTTAQSTVTSLKPTVTKLRESSRKPLPELLKRTSVKPTTTISVATTKTTSRRPYSTISLVLTTATPMRQTIKISSHTTDSGMVFSEDFGCRSKGTQQGITPPFCLA